MEKEKETKEQIVKKIKRKMTIKSKNNNTCRYCGCTNIMLMTIDHRIPLSRGGSDDDSNKDCVCYICNQLKGSLTPEEFKKYLKNLYGLYKLHKMKVVFVPNAFQLNFYPRHYPDFDLGKAIEKKENGQKENNV